MEATEGIENCLLCFTKCDDWIFVNSEKGNKLNIKTILLKYFCLELQNDDVSKAICTMCWESIINFHEFYVRIESIQKTNNKNDGVYKIKNVNENLSPEVKITTDIIELPNATVMGEASMTIREKLYISEYINIKNENSDFINECNNDDDDGGGGGDIDNFIDMDNRNHNNDNDDCNNDDDDDDDDNDNDEDVEFKDSIGKDNKKTLPAPIQPPAKKFKRTNSINSAKNITIVAVSKKKRIRKKQPSNKTDYTEHNKKLIRYCQMKCEICGQQFTDMTVTKRHYREKHNQKGYIRCCGIKLRDYSTAMQHYEWHENPQAYKCELCQKCYTDKFKLKSHTEQIHTPQNERHFKCDLCSRSYAREFLLIRHKRISHPKEEDKKFKCDICGVKFAIMSFLRSHIRRVHENADARICDICAKFFKCAKAYEHHHAVEHTNTQRKVQCDLCGVWLKHQVGLKDHMKRHKTIVTEKCETCGRICPNKKALRAHFRTVHLNIQYPCTVCAKPFKNKNTLKEHMSQHTGEKDLYTCLFCPKTFRSSANMYAHRKRAHPKEYEENRLLGKKYPD